MTNTGRYTNTSLNTFTYTNTNTKYKYKLHMDVEVSLQELQSSLSHKWRAPGSASGSQAKIACIIRLKLW